METNETSDEALVRRYYQADEGALKMLFERYKESLFNFALRFTGNRADAEDAVSHTFMMVCEKKYAFRQGAGFKTWAYTVARNVCLSKIRSRHRFYSLWLSKDGSDEGSLVDVVDPNAVVREQIDQKEIAALVQKVIHRLPQEQKEALLLREYQGLNYEEISQVLGCSLEKVKVLIFRARTFLKETLPPALLEGR
jgi:RNA polymerase sigma-70 factor, ECF subfamily